jgi:hypothetical protein
VASPDELLELDGLTLGQFYAAMASAVQADGGDTATVTLLQTLSTKANLTSTIAIRDVLDIESGNTAALAASFNALDLVVGAAYAANRTSSVSVPGLSVQLPGVTDLTTSLTVGDAPRLACGSKGRARARTGQVDLALSGNVLDVTTDLNGSGSLTSALGPLGAILGGGLFAGVSNGTLRGGPLTAVSRVDTEVHLAQADGLLTNIICGEATSAGNAEGIDVAVTASALSSVSVDISVRITGSLTLSVVNLLGVSVDIATITIDINAQQTTSATQATAPTTLSFRHPDDVYGVPESFGSGIVVGGVSPPTVSGNALIQIDFIPGYGRDGDIHVSGVAGLSGVLNGLIATATSNVNGLLIGPLNSVVIPSLQDQAGIKVGGADLFALPRPSCNDPRLAG